MIKKTIITSLALCALVFQTNIHAKEPSTIKINDFVKAKGLLTGSVYQVPAEKQSIDKGHLLCTFSFTEEEIEEPRSCGGDALEISKGEISYSFVLKVGEDVLASTNASPQVYGNVGTSHHSMDREYKEYKRDMIRKKNADQVKAINDYRQAHSKCIAGRWCDNY